MFFFYAKYFRCATVNFCVSSGFSVIAVFVTLLCAILASAFYKYSTSREEMSIESTAYTLIDQVNNDPEQSETMPATTESSTTPLPSVVADDQSNPSNTIESLNEIEISVTEDEKTLVENDANHTEVSNDIIIDTIEGTEDEIQKQQIANIYRLLNDQHLINNWSTTDFLDQLKMYGLHTYDEDESESS